MSHLRKDVRDAVKAALDAAKPSGWTVTLERGRKMAEADMPCAVIAVTRDSAVADGQCVPLARTMMVQVALFIASGPVPDDAADEACAWVEKAIAADATLGGVVVRSHYRGTAIDVFAGAETPVAQAVLDFEMHGRKPVATF